MSNKMYTYTTSNMHFFLIVFLFLAATTLGLPPSGRIYGGKKASPGQFPFIVSIDDPEHGCGGSIINKNWVLTASHCLDNLSNEATVLVGTDLLHSGGVRYNITQSIAHENWDVVTLQNDIALIQIDGEFEYNELVQPIDYFDIEENSTCAVAGWGVTEDGDVPEDLLFVELTGLTYEVCSDLIAGAWTLSPEQVCSLGPEGKAPCIGDSGGPLVCDGKLAGIVSFAIAACAKGIPDVYAKPGAYVDWINEKIQA